MTGCQLLLRLNCKRLLSNLERDFSKSSIGKQINDGLTAGPLDRLGAHYLGRTPGAQLTIASNESKIIHHFQPTVNLNGMPICMPEIDQFTHALSIPRTDG